MNTEYKFENLKIRQFENEYRIQIRQIDTSASLSASNLAMNTEIKNMFLRQIHNIQSY